MEFVCKWQLKVCVVTREKQNSTIGLFHYNQNMFTFCNVILIYCGFYFKIIIIVIMQQYVNESSRTSRFIVRLKVVKKTFPQILNYVFSLLQKIFYMYIWDIYAIIKPFSWLKIYLKMK